MIKKNFIVYDNFGEILGYTERRISGKGIQTVIDKSGRPKYVCYTQIGRIENYNLMAEERIARKGGN
ncbi:MAG: hypothetical protein ACRCX2_12505 [Paraclostridium sp.]